LGPVHAGVLLLVVYLFHGLDRCCQTTGLLSAVGLSSGSAVAVPVAQGAVRQLLERTLTAVLPAG